MAEVKIEYEFGMYKRSCCLSSGRYPNIIHILRRAIKAIKSRITIDDISYENRYFVFAVLEVITIYNDLNVDWMKERILNSMGIYLNFLVKKLNE